MPERPPLIRGKVYCTEAEKKIALFFLISEARRWRRRSIGAFAIARLADADVVHCARKSEERLLASRTLSVVSVCRLTTCLNF